jgi:ectoine hydroxylase-related dioxygenase (phytanoyl-CoA dioxygenase family)
MERKIFKNISLQESFDRNGYVIVDALNTNEIEDFEKKYELIEGKTNTTFESTMNNLDPNHKKKVHDLVLTYFKCIYDKLLIDYIPVSGNFVSKRPGTDGEVSPHQDWSFSDENEYRGVNIWMPFVDTNEDNGAIYIVKGSHLLPAGKRGSYVPDYFDQNLFYDYRDFTPVFMRKGQALIYDLRCIHASPPNKTENIRVAAGCACVPKEAQLLHYFYDENKNELMTFHVSPDFFLKYSYLNSGIPTDLTPVEVEKDFLVEKYDYELQSELLRKQKINGVSFISEKLQKKYEQDGYVIVDCFSENQVSEILNFYNENSEWFKEGFLSSVYAPEIDYRYKVDQFLEPYANEILDRFFNDYKIIISSFMVKGVGENSEMYPHQDWTNVDETQYTSFNIWIPLVDVNHSNGALYLLKGSHLLPFSFRGSNIPDAITDYSLFNSKTLSYIPLKAGQALIYDHRCIHYSPINKTNTVRPACSINVAPKQAQLMHFFYNKDSALMTCYEADKNFYFNHVISQNKIPDKGNILYNYNPGSFIKFDQSTINHLFSKQEVKSSLLDKLKSLFC